MRNETENPLTKEEIRQNLQKLLDGITRLQSEMDAMEKSYQKRENI